jgi:integrase
MDLPEQKISKIPFIPARLTEGKEWYISYYAFNPVENKLVRKKIKLNRIQQKTHRRLIARKMANEINDKLFQGWNPFIENEAPKSFHKLEEAINTYWAIQQKEAEENTLRSYQSFLKCLREYLYNIKKQDMFVYEFSERIASGLMLQLNSSLKISALTYNNYLAYYNILFNWMVQFHYIKMNPFKLIEKKALKKTKNRIPVPEDIKQKLKSYLQKENMNFLIIMLIEYYCLLRPKEISYLRIKDIDLQKQFIRVDSAEAKNDEESFRTIPEYLMPYLEKLDLTGDHELFVFSHDKPYKFIPGKNHMDPRKISKYWARLRKKFGFGLNIKFYSLKDSGIIDLLDAGVSIEDVRDQADHHNISVTSVYARHLKPNGSAKIKELARDF